MCRSTVAGFRKEFVTKPCLVDGNQSTTREKNQVLPQMNIRVAHVAVCSRSGAQAIYRLGVLSLEDFKRIVVRVTESQIGHPGRVPKL